MRRVHFLFAVLLFAGTISANAQYRNGDYYQPNTIQQDDTLRLTIDEALQVALNDNLQIKIAGEEIARVDYLKKENWYQLLPSLNGQAGYNYNLLKPAIIMEISPGVTQKITIGQDHNYSVAGQLDVPIYSAATFKNIRISEIDMKIALESARSTSIDLAMQVKNAFYGILMMKKTVGVLEESYNNSVESAKNIAEKYEVGMASEYEKLRSDVSARNILPSLTQAQNALELSKLQLKMLLSLDMDLPFDVVGELSDFEGEILNYLPYTGYSFEANSDLRSLDLNIEKMNKTAELIQAQRLPSIKASATYQYAMQENKFEFKGPNYSTLSMGLSLTVPIFNKLQLSLKEKQTQAGIRQMEYQKSLVEESLSLSVKNSINEMVRAKDQLISDQEAVKLAEKAYEISKTMYDKGVGTILDLTSSELALTNSKVNLSQTIYNYLTAKNQLEKVLGITEQEVNEKYK